MAADCGWSGAVATGVVQTLGAEKIGVEPAPGDAGAGLPPQAERRSASGTDRDEEVRIRTT
jgi:hypothetical protein